MRSAIRAGALSLIVAVVAQIAWADGGTVHVRGYTRKDGTYVRPYDRAAPGTATRTSTTTNTAPSVSAQSPSVASNSNTSKSADANTARPQLETFKTTTGKEYKNVMVRSVEPDGILVSYEGRVLMKVLFSELPKDVQQRFQYKPPNETAVPGVTRDANGKIKRSELAKREFMQMTGFPNGRPGYVVDHIVPLKRGGCDCPSNMQWQTIQEAKAKDKWE
jgi:hypothetical protein